MKVLLLIIQKIWPMLKFLKVGQTSREKNLVPVERSCHKEHTYEIPIAYQSKDMANVKVFEKWVRLQGKKLWYQ
jgi:hypothetical protein